MNTTISNHGLPNQLPQASGNPGQGQAPAAPAPAVETHAAASVKAGDQVKLTDSAQALQQASKVNDNSAIDQAKVDKIRAALADGSYKIDAGRIADGLIGIERQLGGAAKA